MKQIARPPGLGEPHGAAHVPIHALPWGLLGLLPAKLADLPDAVRGQLGPALDAGRARLVLDDDGSVIAMRGVRL